MHAKGLRAEHVQRWPKYGCLMVDPPWAYRGAGPRKGCAGGVTNINGTRNKGVGSAERYGSMTIPELEALRIGSVAARSAHLWLWTTNSFLEEAHALARAWGFKPTTVITWAKVKKGTREPSMKSGYWFRGASEHVVFATRGTVPRKAGALPTWFPHERLPHSVKPQFFFDLARSVSPGPYVEVFARKQRAHWDAWGDEVNSNVDL